MVRFVPRAFSSFNRSDMRRTWRNGCKPRTLSTRVGTGELRVPHMMLDARYEKARMDKRIVDVAALMANGVKADGHWEMQATEVALADRTASWSAFLSGLVELGLNGVEPVVSDRHPALKEARMLRLPMVDLEALPRHFW